MKIQILLTFIFFLLLASYLHSDEISSTLNSSKQLTTQDNLDCGLTDDFATFLKQSAYEKYNFTRPDLKCGAYGGKTTKTEKILKVPIIFLHGNSDVAFGRGQQDGYAEWQTGFRNLAAYLTANSYKKSQLYTTTWGNANPDKASQNYHSKQNLIYLRAFVQAVIQYTQTKQIIIIGHSMGVTLGRSIIKGGDFKDHKQGFFNLGQGINEKVKVFVGIAGANYGLTACYGASETLFQTCNNIDGFYPGLLATSSPSAFLNNLNIKGGPEGKKIYTIWSKYDNLIGEECIVWGKVTCRIPSQTGQIVKTQKQWNHFALRDNTGKDIISLF